MLRCDALIVGGGPAGSTCARALRQAGWHVVLIDRARFPRDKPCAGWITPDVFRLLNLDPAAYRDAGLTLQPITGFRTGVLGERLLETRYQNVVSYAIRRCEFDHFLLRRACVQVIEGMAFTALRRRGDVWVVNEAIEAPIVVGAGGHFCPVAHQISKTRFVPAPVVVKQAEFRPDDGEAGRSPETPELFFCHDLDGYGWCVRCGQYLNVGIGRRDHRRFAAHVNAFVSFLEITRTAPGASLARWRGHAYSAAGAGARSFVDDGRLLVGDAAGVACPESGEGIRPAIESAQRAAETLINAQGRYRRDDLLPYDAAVRRLTPPVWQTPAMIRTAAAAIGRTLLRSPVFTRHVVIDRWFLRT